MTQHGVVWYGGGWGVDRTGQREKDGRKEGQNERLFSFVKISFLFYQTNLFNIHILFRSVLFCIDIYIYSSI